MSAQEFAVEDYKLALQYLQAQFERLWQRFNFFLTVQMALFGFLGWLAYDDKNSREAIPFVAVLGIFVSVLWYIVAAQDRFLVEVYRDRTKEAAESISRFSDLDAKDYAINYIGAQAQSGIHSPLSWYWRPLSITRLPVWVAISLALVWLALLYGGESWLYTATR